MIVRRFEDILPSERAVHADTWSSFRLLTRDDGLGFSLHETWIHPGTATHIWYKHHVEAVYCLEGEGEVELVDRHGDPTGARVPLKPGVMYALDAHDRHLLRAHTRLRLICVFNPPLRGDETHDRDGAYPAAAAPVAPAPSAAARPPVPDAHAQAALAEARLRGATHDPARDADEDAVAQADTRAATGRAHLNGDGPGPRPPAGAGLSPPDHINGDAEDDDEEDTP